MSGVSFNMSGGPTGRTAPFKMQGGAKSIRPAPAFAPDSPTEQVGMQEPKRQRLSPTETLGNNLPSQQSFEPSEEEKRTAEKLAQFVAKNGRKYEAITKEKNTHGGPFKFLFDTNSPGYRYYSQKVEEYSKPQGFLANIPIPRPPTQPYPAQHTPDAANRPSTSYTQPVGSNIAAPYTQQSQAHGQFQPPLPVYSSSQPPLPPGLPAAGRAAYQQPHAPPPATPQAPTLGTSYPASGAYVPPAQASAAQAQTSQTAATGQRKRRSRWQESPADTPPTASHSTLGGLSKDASSAQPAADDSVSAMERFAAQAAAREQERADKEASVPLLNETSFDRRRVMAVYKDDGSKGHHMHDFIPKEELAKLLAKSGTADGKAQAEAIEAASRIQSDNIGHKLLSKMGWKEGEGLGATGAGLAAPVSASSEFGGDKRGLGAEDHTAVKEGDDEFEVYRKRMMLGYKHRPNPLGNPRKNYY